MEPRVSVNLSFDFDADSLWMSWGARGMRALSRGEFAATTGVPRILDLLDNYGVTSTWFIPGHDAESYPEQARAVADRGHEIGNHGYVHEAFDKLPDVESHRLIRKAQDALENVTGQRPRGIRLPNGDFTGALLEFIHDEGFDYDSSRMDGEYEIYWARGADTILDEGPNIKGPSMGLVEVPISWMMQDLIYFERSYDAPLLLGGFTPSMVEEIWIRQFDYMYERIPGGVLTLTLHPQSIGWGGRIGVLENFIENAMSKDGVRFTTCAQTASEFRSSNPRPDQITKNTRSE
jgi:peptidoglycan/xylan/chitin deacetylase (PgdA/CDA1 family)